MNQENWLIKRRGFTLIELMVSITIIGILLALSLTAYEGSRKTARDGRRKADLEQIRSALEMYRADNDSYPDDLDYLNSDPNHIYIATIPSDPLVGKEYYFDSEENSYTLCAALEINEEAVTGCGGADACGADMVCNYKVTNP